MVLQSSRAPRTVGHSKDASQKGKCTRLNLEEARTSELSNKVHYINKNYLKVMYTNADSLRNKLEELKFRIEQESERPNVICITELQGKKL